MADEKKVEIVIFNSGHPLKMDIEGKKLQLQDGINNVPESLAVKVIKFYGNKVKLASEVPSMVNAAKEVKPEVVPEVKKEEVKPEVVKHKGRPKKA